MRWKYLLPRLVVMGLVWVFFLYAFDPLVRRVLVAAGQRAIGAKVDLGAVETTFFPPSVELRGVAVADRSEPGTNAVEFDTFRLQLAGEPLLHGALVIREGTLTGLRWGTQRADSGRIEDDATPGLAGRMLGAMRRQLADFGRERLADFLRDLRQDFDPRRLETVQLADGLAEQWKARFDGYEQRAKDLEARIEALHTGVGNVKGKTLEKIETYRRAAVEVNQLLAEAQQIRNEMQGLVPQARLDLQQIEAAGQRDRLAVQQKLDRLKPDADGLSRMLLGPEVVQRLEQAVAWLRWSREKVDLLTADLEPPRLRGTDIEFARHQPTPGFVLEKLSISGVAEIGDDVVPFEGTLSDASSNPVLHGKPTVLQVAGRVRESDVRVETTLDQTGVAPVHAVAMEWILPEETRVRLGDADDLALDVTASRTRCEANLKLTGDVLTGRLILCQEGVDVAAVTADRDETSQLLGRVVESATQDLRQIDLVVELSGTADHPDWTLHSNLGPQLADGVHAFVVAEVDRHRAELAARVEDATQAKLAEFRTLLGERYTSAEGLLSQHEARAREIVEKVAGRPADLQGLFRR